jgi:hypothetical protein
MFTLQGEKTLGYFETATGIGIVLFWMLFFAAGLGPANPPACYLAFEYAFPIADGVLALSLIVAGFLLTRGRPWGRFLSLPCAGGLIFLGLVDISFNVQNGLYAGPVVELLQNAAINLWSCALGIATVVMLTPSTPAVAGGRDPTA